jgi:hypothetical protein
LALAVESGLNNWRGFLAVLKEKFDRMKKSSLLSILKGGCGLALLCLACSSTLQAQCSSDPLNPLTVNIKSPGGFTGSFTAPGITFATDTGYNWHPFGLSDFDADIRGCLKVDADGTYTFTLNSDDGSQLFIDGTLVVDDGGVHGPQVVSGSAGLTAGTHSFEVTFFECCGGPSGVDLKLPAGVSYTCCGYDLKVEVGYEEGGCSSSGLYCANPDSGFVLISNVGPSPFVGELRLDGVSGVGSFGHEEVHDTSGPGFVLSPGSSFRLEAGDEASNYGGWNKTVCGPDNGFLLSISGTAGGLDVGFSVYDKDIHSGNFFNTGVGGLVAIDNYILQGGGPNGEDTGDPYEEGQAHAIFHVQGTCCDRCTLTCPPDVKVCNDPGKCSAVVNYAGPNLSGGCSDVTITCDAPSGSEFPVGTTTVHCRANRPDGTLIAECSFNVTVTDNEAPTIACPDTITQCNDRGQCGAVVKFEVRASDNCPDVKVTCSQDSGTFFPKGTTTVVCTATDASGQSSRCTFDIVVKDCEAPTAHCVSTTNPSGNKVPTAGSNPKSGQNPDGFYQLVASDNCGNDDLKIYVGDTGSGFVAGPFKNGDKVKITQAPGVTPNSKPMAGVVVAHIQLKGDAKLWAADSSGNMSAVEICHVAPLPK